MEALNYEDWGTVESYKNYMHKSIVLFCDIDGVLLLNGSKFSKNGWEYEVLEKNLNSLKKISNNYNAYLIITTSRPESEKKLLEELFEKNKIRVQHYLMGLPHTKRILINDYAETNSYPTAISINLLRNSDELGMILEGVLNKAG
jgi:hypothetical protein